jgi:hypothetical protein
LFRSSQVPLPYIHTYLPTTPMYSVSSSVVLFYVNNKRKRKKKKKKINK